MYQATPRQVDDLRKLVVDVVIECSAGLAPKDFAFGYSGEDYADFRQLDDGRLTYAIRLGALATDAGIADFAATPSSVMAPIDAWIARPIDSAHAKALSFVFKSLPASGIRILHNLSPRDAGQAAPEITLADWEYGGYTVFTARAPIHIETPGPAAFNAPGRPGPATAHITIAVLDDGFAMDNAYFAQWISRFAGLVGRYWGGFPADHLLIAVAPNGRRGGPFGRVRGGGGATMTLRISKQETPKFLHERDWVLTHELIHIGAPFAPERPPWFMEGMATYLEPLIRALGGATPTRAVWEEWVRAMPNGARAFNMEGLDGRGHPYWSGALFFMLAQYEAVKQGHGEGLAPCFRAMRQKVGDASVRTNVQRLISICDQALGAPIMAKLYEQYRRPAAFDLSEVWRSLGLQKTKHGLQMDASGAKLRRLFFDFAQFPAPLP